MTEKTERLGLAALKLVYPTRAVCMGCDSQAGFSREWLCDDCRRELAKRWVGAAPPPGGSGIDGAAYAYLYGGPAGGMVRHMKYQGVKRLADPMARAMASALALIQPTGAECVVPVPMHPKRLRERGFNHAALLARKLGGLAGLPEREALARIRNTPQQARLSEEERRANMTDAFAAAEPVAGKRILLVDDVCTTGATVADCARALKQAGAAAVYLVCFATANHGEDGV